MWASMLSHCSTTASVSVYPDVVTILTSAVVLAPVHSSIKPINISFRCYTQGRVHALALLYYVIRLDS